MELTEAQAAGKAAFESLPGRAVYVRTEDTSVFRVANIEGEIAGALLVSFESPDGGPRHPTEPIEPSQVIDADEIENMANAETTLMAGRRLVRTTSRSYVEIVECSETNAGPTRRILARKLSLNGREWGAVESVREYANENIFTAGFLAFLQKWRWLQPVDPFYDVIADEIGAASEIVSAAELHIADVRIRLEAHVTLSDIHARLEAVAHPMLAMLLNDLQTRLLIRARVRSIDAVLPWIARLVAIHGASIGWDFEGGYKPGSISLESPWFDVRLAPGQPVFTREIFDGIDFEAGTDTIYRREPPFPAHPLLRADPTGIRTRLFGRNALIYRPPRHSEEERRVTAVLYHGRQLPSAEQRALGSLLGYLAGGRAAHVLTESFDVRRKLRIQFVDRGVATKRMSPPVPLARPTHYAALVVRHLPALAGRLAAIYRTGDARTLDAALHHYAEGVDSAYPMTRILRMSVAFEALVNLVTGDDDPNEAIATKEAFRNLSQALKATLTGLAAEPNADLTHEQAKRFAVKLSNLNLGSNTKRIKRFWHITGVHHTKTDDELIRRLRNESVHQGFVGSEATSRAIYKNHRDANRLVDIFNRCFLAYLGYEGPVLTADTRRWVHAKSGRAFDVPPAQGPKLSINLTSPAAPALAPADLAALEGLRRLPRRTTDPGI